MKIVIIGDGKVGYMLAKKLSEEEDVYKRQSPARVGLMPTFCTKISESGTSSPAAIK